MVLRNKHTSWQRSVACKSEELSIDSDFYESSYFRREIFLDFEYWQNIAENRLPWYEYNHSSKEQKDVASLQRIIIPCIQEIITSGLTNRQKEVVTMYFMCGYTQISIARKLGISQPTVSQHLNGKKRDGKKIGGSIRKVRKIIHRKSSTYSLHSNKSYIMNTLGRLLDEQISLRKRHELIRSILK